MEATEVLPDRWIDKEDVVYKKKERSNAIRNNMDGPRDYILSELSQAEKDKHHVIALICEVQKKNYTNELIYETEIDSQTQKTNLTIVKGEVGRDKWGDWD